MLIRSNMPQNANVHHNLAGLILIWVKYFNNLIFSTLNDWHEMIYKGWYAVKQVSFILPNLYDNMESNFSTFLTETIAVFPTLRNLFRTSRWVKWKQNFKWISFFPYSLWLFTKIFAEVCHVQFSIYEVWVRRLAWTIYAIKNSNKSVCLPSQLMCVLSLTLFEKNVDFWFLS